MVDKFVVLFSVQLSSSTVTIPGFSIPVIGQLNLRKLALFSGFPILLEELIA